MRLTDIFERKSMRMGGKELSSTTTLSGFKIGFEFEFGVTAKALINYTNPDDVKTIDEFYDLGDILDQATGTTNDEYIELFNDWRVDKSEHIEDAKERQEYMNDLEEEEWINEDGGLEEVLKLLANDGFIGDFIDVDDKVFYDISTEESYIRRSVADIIQYNYISPDAELYVSNDIDYDKDINAWYVEPDASIYLNDRDTDATVEVVSPVFDNLNDAFSSMEDIFQCIDEVGYTNSTTGLHINISFDGNPTVDMLKLILLVGEEYVAKIFDRVDHEYAKGQIERLTSILAKEKNIIKRYREDPEETTKYIEELIVSDHGTMDEGKYTSINFKHMEKSGRIEFRITGGRDYQKKGDTIQRIIKRYLYAIKAAIDPSFEREAYVKKLMKLLMNSEEFVSGARKGDSKVVNKSNWKPLLDINPHLSGTLARLFNIANALDTATGDYTLNLGQELTVKNVLWNVFANIDEDRAPTIKDITMQQYKILQELIQIFKIDRNIVKHHLPHNQEDMDEFFAFYRLK